MQDFFTAQNFLLILISFGYTNREVYIMAKKGMKRYYANTEKNDVKPVEELQGKVKSGKEKAKTFTSEKRDFANCKTKRVVSPFGSSLSDSAIENIANDLGLTAADMQDFKE